MADLTVSVSERAVASIIINRESVRNSLNASLVKELRHAIKFAAKNASVRSILLGGEGTKAFCAGADLKELHDFSTSKKRAFFQDLAHLITDMGKCTKPIVAKVHGFALAGGCGLAAAADIIIASDDAVFGLPEINIGIAPLVVMAPLHRAIGRRALTRLVLTGELIDAHTALSIGLVSKVVAKDFLDQEAVSIAEKLAERSPPALASAKKALYEVSEKDYFKVINDYALRVSALASSKDAEEGRLAFIEKRAPSWPSLHMKRSK
jgi:methylglutaconyl-CoA hydratase